MFADSMIDHSYLIADDAGIVDRVIGRRPVATALRRSSSRQ